LANTVIALLRDDKPVALGFETPLFIPVPEDSARLGKARPCDAGGPAWSGSPGATVLAQALAQIPWILSRVREAVPCGAVHFAWEPFSAAESGLLLWEAFVSGKAKGGSHEKDAIAGVEAFCKQLPDVGDANAYETPRPFSLIAAAALWAGLEVTPEELRRPCVLVRATAP
jgi:hypothetical protein